jgi:V/A-type H+-transporting ATPase subunit B
MNAGIGKDKTRADHRQLADQLYSLYAEGRDLRRLVAIIGEASLSDQDRGYLRFAERFEQEFVTQDRHRSMDETLQSAWRVLEDFDDAALKRISPEIIETFRPNPSRNRT